MKLWAGIVAVVLAACGGGGGVSNDAGSAAGVAPAPAPAPIIPAVPAAGPNNDTTFAATSIAGWTLVWSDEFSGSGLPDSSKWTYDTDRNKVGWWNNEKQYYANARLENSRVQDGKLIIEARQERFTAAADFGGQNYTSARLITRGLASWSYGFWEVRAKLPCGLGTWPAIWMLGTGGRWPEDGEIDILEQRGTAAADKQQILGTVHTKAYNWSGGTMGVAKGASTALPNACTAFNNYQLRWEADRIVIGVNGVEYFTFMNPNNGDRNQWPFNAPQYLILNLAMGGDLGGAINDTQLPAQMEVDYVRVYKRL
jgi:beta-glucanase (GH16 family)